MLPFHLNSRNLLVLIGLLMLIGVPRAHGQQSEPPASIRLDHPRNGPISGGMMPFRGFWRRPTARSIPVRSR